MSTFRTIAVAAAFALLPAVAQAADDEERWVTAAMADKPQVVFDPAKAYVLVQADYQVSPLLMRRPSADEAARHEAKRASELAKEHAKWVKKHADWERTIAALAKIQGADRPKEPQEPTDANFPWPPYEQVHPVYIGPQNRFAKANGGASVYLQEVEPGEYTFYGNVGFGVPGGTCACLGTVAFRAEAGKVTSLGKMKLPALDSLKGPKEQRIKTTLDLPEGTTLLAFEPAAVSDPRIPADKIVPARFTPVSRMPNWFGLEVDRLTAIAGVMRYDRDKVVDLTASAPPAAP